MSRMYRKTKNYIISQRAKEKTKMSNAIDKIKKLHSAMSIERKDISLKDLVSKEAEKDGTVTVEIIGFASKFVPKYHNENNQGYHTMIYLKDGRKTGAFSNALYDFARFFYEGAGMDTTAEFNKLMLAENGFLKVKVSPVKLDGGKSTYNFEIVDGDVDTSKLERIGAIAGNTPLLLEQ